MTSSSTDPREIRRFGLIAFLFFGLLSGLGLWRDRAFPLYFFGLLSVIGLLLLALPVRLKPLYEGWMKTAHFFGRMVTLIVLTMAYYLVITPAAGIKRLFGGPPLPLSPDRERSTYWVDREEPAQPQERFYKRY